MPDSTPRSLVRPIVRALVSVAMVSVGVLHFVNPAPFVRIVPAVLPARAALVYVSGVFEILGGVGLQIPALRRYAGWGLVALYVGVFPANVNMAVHRISLNDGPPLPDWALWLRLPFQALFIVAALWVSRPDRPPTRA